MMVIDAVDGYVHAPRRRSLITADVEKLAELARKFRVAIVVAANVLPETKRATLAQVVEGKASIPGRGLVVFKSVGTALQDLALAARYYELLKDKPGTVIGPVIASQRSKAKRKAQAV